MSAVLLLVGQKTPLPMRAGKTHCRNLSPRWPRMYRRCLKRPRNDCTRLVYSTSGPGGDLLLTKQREQEASDPVLLHGSDRGHDQVQAPVRRQWSGWQRNVAMDQLHHQRSRPRQYLYARRLIKGRSLMQSPARRQYRLTSLLRQDDGLRNAKQAQRSSARKRAKVAQMRTKMVYVN